MKVGMTQRSERRKDPMFQLYNLKSRNLTKKAKIMNIPYLFKMLQKGTFVKKFKPLNNVLVLNDVQTSRSVLIWLSINSQLLGF